MLISATCKNDIDDLIEIEQRSFTSDFLSKRQMIYHIQNPRALFLSLRERPNGKPIGYALFFRRKKQAARFYSLVINQTHRGKGYASMLMTAGLDKLHEEGINCVRLEVDKKDEKTIALYQKNGFKIMAELPSYYQDGRDALRMERKMNDD